AGGGRRACDRGGAAGGPPSTAVRPVRATGAVVRRGAGPTSVAGPRPRRDAGLPGGRRAAGGLPPARGDGDGGALGPSRCRTHLRLRSAGRLDGLGVLKSATAQLMRTSWRTVGSIVERVVADRDRAVDRLAGLTRIGID